MTKLINTLTGLAGFVTWVWLVRQAPEHGLTLALGVLLVLVGFGGKDTIKDILKTWKE